MTADNLSSIGRLRLEHDTLLHKSNAKSNSDFSKVLNDKIENSTGIQFSKHAITRMNERGVDVSEKLQNDLNAAVDKAREKGAKDVIVIGPSNAFVVNVPNNTVVTTMNLHEMREKVFTNIDSAIIL